MFIDTLLHVLQAFPILIEAKLLDNVPMRVLIIGPAFTPTSMGGVAMFDETLCDGFYSLGDICKICTLDPVEGSRYIPLKPNVKGKAGAYFSFGKIAKAIKEFQPHLVISSLQYSSGISQYRRAYPNATYVHVFHGFRCPSNGKLAARIINKELRKASKKADKVVSVSPLTAFINEKFCLAKSDAIIPNPVSLMGDPVEESSRDIDYLYVGRLYPDKGVKMIADAFLRLKKANPELKCAIAGKGELEDLLESSPYKESVDYLGALTPEEVQKTLSRTRFMVSLNPLEPFGITFVEALANGCNVVTQPTAGITPYCGKKDYFHFTESLSDIDLAQDLATLGFHLIPEADIKEIKERFSPSTIATAYKALAQK